jgi:hypothetical protein
MADVCDVAVKQTVTSGDGEPVRDEVECPRNSRRFNAKTGAATRMSAMFLLRTFPVKVAGKNILVAAEQLWAQRLPKTIVRKKMRISMFLYPHFYFPTHRAPPQFLTLS